MTKTEVLEQLREDVRAARESVLTLAADYAGRGRDGDEIDAAQLEGQAKAYADVLRMVSRLAGVELEPGEHVAPTGVVVGSGAHPEVPRFGADETDQDPIPGAQDAGWAAYWATKPGFRDGE